MRDDAARLSSPDGRLLLLRGGDGARLQVYVVLNRVAGVRSAIDAARRGR
jgi:hypothetical protein